MTDPPAREKYPNWKICQLLAWMNFIFPTAYLLGIKVAIDKMIMSFQGIHIDKRQITYKAEGDGFQADALDDEGYCYQFYIQNNNHQKSTADICHHMQE